MAAWEALKNQVRTAPKNKDFDVFVERRRAQGETKRLQGCNALAAQPTEPAPKKQLLPSATRTSVLEVKPAPEVTFEVKLDVKPEAKSVAPLLAPSMPRVAPVAPVTSEVGAMPKLPGDPDLLQITAICANTHNDAPKKFQDAFVSEHKFVMVQMKDTLGTFERLSLWVNTVIKYAVVRFDYDDDDLTDFMRNVWMLPPQATKIGETRQTDMLPVMPLIMYPTIQMVEKLIDVKKIPFRALVVVDNAYAPDPTIRKLRNMSYVVIVPPLCDKLMETCLSVLKKNWNLPMLPNEKFLLDRANGDPRWLYNNLYFDKLQGNGRTMCFDTRLSDEGLLRQANMFLLHGYREIWRYHVSPPLTPIEMGSLWKRDNIVRVEPNEVYAHGNIHVRDVKTKECVAATDTFLDDGIKLYVMLNYPVVMLQADMTMRSSENSLASVDAMSFVADALCDADIIGGKHGFCAPEEVDYVFMQATRNGISKYFPKCRGLTFNWKNEKRAHDNYVNELQRRKTQHANADNWYKNELFNPVGHLWDEYAADGNLPTLKIKEEAAKFMTVALLLAPPLTPNALLQDVGRVVPDPEDRKAKTVAEWFGRRTGFDGYDDNIDAQKNGRKTGYDFTVNDAWMLAWAMLAKTPNWANMAMPELVNTILGALRLAIRMRVNMDNLFIAMEQTLKQQPNAVPELVERMLAEVKAQPERDCVLRLPTPLEPPKLSFHPCTTYGCKLERCRGCLKKADWHKPCDKCKAEPCVSCRGYLDILWRILMAKKYAGLS